MSEAADTSISYAKTFDTPEWRAQRDSLLRSWVANDAAVDWIIDFYTVCEYFDDCYDKDNELDEHRTVRILQKCLVDIPSNNFFQMHSHILIPQISFVITLWQGANWLELFAEEFFEAKNDKKKKINEAWQKAAFHNLHRSFTLRNVYAMIVITVIELVRGRDVAKNYITPVMDFFGGESMKEYIDGFDKNAFHGLTMDYSKDDKEVKK